MAWHGTRRHIIPKVDEKRMTPADDFGFVS
jgi:hypothetical protein